MTLAFFLVAVVVWALFEWQRRRHRLEMEVLAARMSTDLPLEPPRVRMLEALLTSYLGLLALVLGSVAVWASIDSARILGSERFGTTHLLGGSLQLMIVLIGGGCALLMLGLRAIRVLRRSRGAPGTTGPIPPTA